MYTIERANDRVIVRMGEIVKLNAPSDSYLVYNTVQGKPQVSKVGDLQDAQLLLAMANTVEIPTLLSR